MADICQLYGADLQIGATGDLLLVGDDAATKQAIIRRLLTNPLDDAWNADYGGGLGRFVGSPISVAQISAVIRAQMRLELSVARQPAPSVVVSEVRDGTASASVTYTSVASDQVQFLSIPIDGV